MKHSLIRPKPKPVLLVGRVHQLRMKHSLIRPKPVLLVGRVHQLRMHPQGQSMAPCLSNLSTQLLL